jgi:hypothetical protein
MKGICSTSLDIFLFFLYGWPRCSGFAIYQMDYFAGNCKSSLRPHCTYRLILCGICSTCGYIMEIHYFFFLKKVFLGLLHDTPHINS